MIGKLDGWYKGIEKSDPQVNISKVSNVTPKMIGQKEIGKQTFKTKAAETRGVLSFTIWLVYEYMIDLGKHVDTYITPSYGDTREVLLGL